MGRLRLRTLLSRMWEPLVSQTHDGKFLITPRKNSIGDVTKRFLAAKRPVSNKNCRTARPFDSSYQKSLFICCEEEKVNTSNIMWRHLKPGLANLPLYVRSLYCCIFNIHHNDVTVYFLWRYSLVKSGRTTALYNNAKKCHSEAGYFCLSSVVMVLN